MGQHRPRSITIRPSSPRHDKQGQYSQRRLALEEQIIMSDSEGPAPPPPAEQTPPPMNPEPGENKGSADYTIGPGLVIIMGSTSVGMTTIFCQHVIVIEENNTNLQSIRVNTPRGCAKSEGKSGAESQGQGWRGAKSQGQGEGETQGGAQGRTQGAAQGRTESRTESGREGSAAATATPCNANLLGEGSILK